MMHKLQIPELPIIFKVAGVWLLWKILETTYNAFFHPLSRFRGPFAAKFTHWWIFRQEMGGNSHLVLEALHERYGSVVRIAPNELSINDVSANQIIYGQGSKFLKARYFYRAFEGEAPNLFTFTEKDAHSRGKKLMSSSFSRASILKYEGVMSSKVQKLITRLTEIADFGKPVPLLDAFRSLTIDTITEFCYGQSFGALESADLKLSLFESFDVATRATVFFQYFPTLRQIARLLQRYKLPGAVAGFMDMEQAAMTGLTAIKSREKTGEAEGTLFQQMMSTAKSKDIVLADEELISEGILMNFAGTDTTAATLAFGLHNLIRRPELYRQLQKELLVMQDENNGQTLTYTQLEENQLLDACLKESLRLTCPVSGKLPRVVPSGGWSYQEVHIPAGVLVSACPYFECNDPMVYPQPRDYRPERWLVEDTTKLQKYFHPFSRGARSCIGQNLSMIEQRLALAAFVLNFSPRSVVNANPKFEQYNTLISMSDLSVFVERNHR